MTYELGVFFALLFWFFHMTMIVVRANSLLAKNLKKLGMRISWINGRPQPISYTEESRSFLSVFFRYALLAIFTLPIILLSWVYVLLVIADSIYRLTKNIGEPIARRELKWKFRNVDMSFDQIIIESMKANGEEIKDIEEIRQEFLREIKQNKIIASL